MECQYCGESLNTDKSTCAWCNAIIQEANCQGVYLIDAAKAVSQQADLTTVRARREALKATFDRYTGA